MDAQRRAAALEDVRQLVGLWGRFRDDPRALKALFDAAMHFAVLKLAPLKAYDFMVYEAIEHPALWSKSLTIVGNAERDTQQRLRARLVDAGEVADAIQLAGQMEEPLSRDEIVRMGNALSSNSRAPLTSIDALIAYAEGNNFSEIDRKRLKKTLCRLDHECTSDAFA